MTPIHDTYQIKMKDGKLLFVEITFTEDNITDSDDYAGYQRMTMETIYKSVKEQGYAAKDIELAIPINSTDPAARDVIKATSDAMSRLNEFFKNGGDAPDKE